MTIIFPNLTLLECLSSQRKGLLESLMTFGLLLLIYLFFFEERLFAHVDFLFFYFDVISILYAFDYE